MKQLLIISLFLSSGLIYSNEKTQNENLHNSGPKLHKVSLGVGNEFYDVGDSDFYESGTPQALVFNFHYVYDQGKEKDFSNLKSYYVFLDLGLKLEEDA